MSFIPIFQGEKTEYARAVGDVNVVAENISQFETLASGLYKHSNKKFPTLPKLVPELNIDVTQYPATAPKATPNYVKVNHRVLLFPP